MFDKIYQYAKSNNLYPKIGYEKKLISVYIILDKNSNFLGFDIKDKKDKEKTLCPDIGKSAFSSNKCNFLVEKIKFAFFKEETKHEFYINTMKQCSDYDDNIKIIYNFLKNNEETDEFTNLLKEQIDNKKFKSDVFISYRIEDKNIEEINSWSCWFDEFRENLNSQKTEIQTELEISLLSGEKVPAMKISQDSPKVNVPSVNGTGDYVFALGMNSFKSYGRENVNIGKEEANIIKAGLENLLSTNHYDKNFKLIHFYKANSNKEDIIFDFCNFKNEQTDTCNEKKDILLNQLFKSIKNGIVPNSEIKDDTYYSAKYISCNGRFFLSNYKEGSFKELYNNLYKWYKDTSLEIYFTDENNNQIKTISFIKNIYSIFFTLLECKNADNKYKQIDAEFGDSKLILLYSIFDNGPIPIKYLYKALKCVNKAVINDDVINKTAIQIIKAYLLRKNKMKGDTIIMETLNKDNKNIAYNCGRMFAVYEQIQYAAQNNLNKNIVDNYFSSAQLATSYVMVKLSNLSMHHMKKLNDGAKIKYLKLLEDISANIEAFPRKLNIEEQGMFVLGYYQQRNDLFKKTI